MSLKAKVFACLLLLTTTTAKAVVEFKSSFLPSMAIFGRADGILSTHNTLLFGGSGLYAGAYGSYEMISVNASDSSLGAALRFGQDLFFEMQAGIFKRTLRQNNLTMQGSGFSANLVTGWHFNSSFGLSVFLSAKKISSGDLDKRTIIDLLPLFSLRGEF